MIPEDEVLLLRILPAPVLASLSWHVTGQGPGRHPQDAERSRLVPRSADPSRIPCHNPPFVLKLANPGHSGVFDAFTINTKPR